MRRLARRILFGRHPIEKMWVPTGLTDPQTAVEVELTGLDKPRSVTGNCVVAALVPLTLGICLPVAPQDVGVRRLALRIRETGESGLQLGTIDLAPLGHFEAGTSRFCTFRITRVTKAGLSFRERWLHPMWRHWKRRRSSPDRQAMSFLDLEALSVFYCCPRPVVLVSVRLGTTVHVFPMDLIGPTASGYFSLALRKSSPAIDDMQRSKQLALSNMPIETSAQIYELGKHTGTGGIDAESLPWPCTRSTGFGLPVPDPATRVRELTIAHWREVGTHVLFLADPVSEVRRTNAPELFQISGYGQWLLERQGRALAPVAA